MNHHSLVILLSFSKIYFWVSCLVCVLWAFCFGPGAVELVFLLLFGIEWMDGYFCKVFFYKCMGSNRPVHRIPHMGDGVYSFLLSVQKADPPNFLAWPFVLYILS